MIERMSPNLHEEEVQKVRDELATLRFKEMLMREAGGQLSFRSEDDREIFADHVIAVLNSALDRGGDEVIQSLVRDGTIPQKFLSQEAILQWGHLPTLAEAKSILPNIVERAAVVRDKNTLLAMLPAVKNHFQEYSITTASSTKPLAGGTGAGDNEEHMTEAAGGKERQPVPFESAYGTKIFLVEKSWMGMGPGTYEIIADKPSSRFTEEGEATYVQRDGKHVYTVVSQKDAEYIARNIDRELFYEEVKELQQKVSRIQQAAEGGTGDAESMYTEAQAFNERLKNAYLKLGGEKSEAKRDLDTVAQALQRLQPTIDRRATTEFRKKTNEGLGEIAQIKNILAQIQARDPQSAEIVAKLDGLLQNSAKKTEVEAAIAELTQQVGTTSADLLRQLTQGLGTLHGVVRAEIQAELGKMGSRIDTLASKADLDAHKNAIGQFNAELQEQMRRMAEANTTLSEHVTRLSQTVEAQTQTIAGLSDKINTLETTRAPLNPYMNVHFAGGAPRDTMPNDALAAINALTQQVAELLARMDRLERGPAAAPAAGPGTPPATPPGAGDPTIPPAPAPGPGDADPSIPRSDYRQIDREIDVMVSEAGEAQTEEDRTNVGKTRRAAEDLIAAFVDVVDDTTPAIPRTLEEHLAGQIDADLRRAIDDMTFDLVFATARLTREEWLRIFARVVDEVRPPEEPELTEQFEADTVQVLRNSNQRVLTAAWTSVTEGKSEEVKGAVQTAFEAIKRGENPTDPSSETVRLLNEMARRISLALRSARQQLADDLVRDLAIQSGGIFRPKYDQEAGERHRNTMRDLILNALTTGDTSGLAQLDLGPRTKAGRTEIEAFINDTNDKRTNRILTILNPEWRQVEAAAHQRAVDALKVENERWLQDIMRSRGVSAEQEEKYKGWWARAKGWLSERVASTLFAGTTSSLAMTGAAAVGIAAGGWLIIPAALGGMAGGYLANRMFGGDRKVRLDTSSAQKIRKNIEKKLYTTKEELEAAFNEIRTWKGRKNMIANVLTGAAVGGVSYGIHSGMFSDWFEGVAVDGDSAIFDGEPPAEVPAGTHSSVIENLNDDVYTPLAGISIDDSGLDFPYTGPSAESLVLDEPVPHLWGGIQQLFEHFKIGPDGALIDNLSTDAIKDVLSDFALDKGVDLNDLVSGADYNVLDLLHDEDIQDDIIVRIINTRGISPEAETAAINQLTALFTRLQDCGEIIFTTR